MTARVNAFANSHLYRFFPDALHPFLSPVCDTIYAILVTLKLCAPFSEQAVEVGNENAASRSEGLPSIMDGGPEEGGRRAEADRRRALALRALDQRLNAAAATRTASTSTGNTAAVAGTAIMGAEGSAAPT